MRHQRLAPPLALVLLFSAWSLPHVSEGRTWHLLAENDNSSAGPVILDDTPGLEAIADLLAVSNSTEKKTIAQMIDEVLEQEFPEEIEAKIGKNYNETAKSSDVRFPSPNHSLVYTAPYPHHQSILDI